MLSCTTKKCQNWHFLVVVDWRHELNPLSLHYQKVPILAKIRNDMEEIKRDRYLKKLIDCQQNGFIKVITGISRCGKSYLLNVCFRHIE